MQNSPESQLWVAALAPGAAIMNALTPATAAITRAIRVRGVRRCSLMGHSVSDRVVEEDADQESTAAGGGQRSGDADCRPADSPGLPSGSNADVTLDKAHYVTPYGRERP